MRSEFPIATDSLTPSSMLKRLALIVALIAPSLPAAAQTVVPAADPHVERLLAADPAGQPLMLRDTPVVPIWSGTNGQLLALVPLADPAPLSPADAVASYSGPSAWRLAGTGFSGAGLQWLLGSGLRVEGSVGQYLAEAPVTCAAGRCDAGFAAAPGSVVGTLGMGWSGASGIDLSYGLSWLERQGQAAHPADLPFGSVPQQAFVLPGLQPYALESEASIFTRARWNLGDAAALDIAATLGRSRLSQAGSRLAPGLPGVDLDQLSLSLGMDVGSLRGAIVGHVLSSDDPMLAGRRWTALDLGVSWRMPWSGELSVGAQNLWSSSPPDPARDTDAQARTPYIQYRQDL